MEVLAAVIGGVVGFIIATGIASPSYRHEGGGWFAVEGGMGCFAGLLLQIVLTAVGAAIGLGVGVLLAA